VLLACDNQVEHRNGTVPLQEEEQGIVSSIPLPILQVPFFHPSLTYRAALLSSAEGRGREGGREGGGPITSGVVAGR